MSFESEIKRQEKICKRGKDSSLALLYMSIGMGVFLFIFVILPSILKDIERQKRHDKIYNEIIYKQQATE